jgi:gamma-glutamylcyclotransferase (GGCT)/AIG2-like uncharacterized protein YtfP
MNIEPRSLFVYGTLRSGSKNRHSRELAQEAEPLGPARMRGRLYRVASYPGMILSDETDEWVVGEVFELRDPETILPVLDRYEGCGECDTPPFEFERATSKAVLDNGRWVTCWVYVYGRRSQLFEEMRIVSGDFWR